MDVTAGMLPMVTPLPGVYGQHNRSQGVIKTKARTKTQHKVWRILGGVRVEDEPNILYEILRGNTSI